MEAGLGIIPGVVARFSDADVTVPHIGWNGLAVRTAAPPLSALPPGARVYFVHSFRAAPTAANEPWVAATTTYGPEGAFISAVQRGAVFATQWHPGERGGGAASWGYSGARTCPRTSRAAACMGAASQRSECNRGTGGP